MWQSLERKRFIESFGIPVIGVSLGSITNCITHLCLLWFWKDLVILHVTEDHLLWVNIALGILILVSILVIIGTIMKRSWLLLPYIILCGIAALAHIILLFIILYHRSDFLDSSNSLTIFIISLLFGLMDFWFLWIVTRFYLILKGSQGHASPTDEDGQPLFDDDLIREHALKETIVSKLLRDYDYKRLSH